MDFQKVSINLKNSNSLQFPLHENPREMIIDPSEFERRDQDQNIQVTLICYRLRLPREDYEVFVYLFKDIDPTTVWYEMKVRHGDRLMMLNGEDTTRMSYEDVYQIIIERKMPFTCQVIWHPELYITLGLNSKPPKEDNLMRLIGDNMYEYLTKTLGSLFHYRPRELFHVEQKTFLESQIDSIPLAQRQLTRLSNHATIEGHPEETMGNLCELNSLFERIGVGLNRDEIYWIWLLMKALLNTRPSIQKLRFWGKIFGLRNNYYIAEADFNAYDELDLNDLEFLKYQEDSEEEIDEEQITNLDQKPPAESIGNGVNQKIFYVSLGIDQPFVQLPLVTPEQIELSRKIQQFFTGDLEAPVECNFSFPGREKHRLRAQIQRISAGSQIVPKNYVPSSINEEEQVDEETIEPKIKFEMNYELEDLARPNGQHWIHYMPYINEQGRSEHSQTEMNTSDLHMDQHGSPIPQKSIEHDFPIDRFDPAWSVGIASTLIPEHASIYVRSNRWPGAFTVGDRHRFENIYVGWGVKIFLENHQANMIDSLPAHEYTLEMIEIDDPTTDEENELFKSAILFSPDENEEFDD